MDLYFNLNLAIHRSKQLSEYYHSFDDCTYTYA